ncbi:hypothetical protein [Polymorphospora rubra]|uniref:Integral membrane protein n=1 Tax=Polymorphospora rubra TaxID=338584 RepID=A0A810N606_9ACTN|nr:hypothetical protein [Polymorphospora rubra]BCJ67619.1 hypothetical protein Prubr_46400 [Polymorphospora rubra]
MTVVSISRVAAVAVSTGTFVFLFVNGSWRRDNLFLVPDLVLCALLAVAAALPARTAVPAMVLAFGVSAGVLMTATSEYAVDGRFGVAAFVGALASAGFAVALVRHSLRTRP